MKTLLTILILAGCLQANVVTAYFTGQQTQVRTVTGQVAWKCQYRYNQTVFYRVFTDYCRANVEVY